MSDQVRALLDRLDGDVARVPAVDVSSVRHRGDQRRRRQGAVAVAGSALAVVAVVLVGFGLNGTSSAHQPPAASITPSLPSPSRPVTHTGHLFTLLSPTLLPGPSTGTAWQVVDPQPGSAAAMCVEASGTGAISPSEQWYATSPNPAPGDEIAVERLMTFDTPEQASAAVQALITRATSCAYDSEAGPAQAAGDETKTLYYRVQDGADNAASMQSLVVVRVGKNLAVLTVATDGNGDIPYIDDLEQQLPEVLAKSIQ